MSMLVTYMPSIAYADEGTNTSAQHEYIALRAKASGTRAVKLSWNSVAGAAYYKVYGKKVGSLYYKTIYSRATKRSYKITKIAGKKLSKKTRYCFYVEARDASDQIMTTATGDRSLTSYVLTGNKKGKYANVKSFYFKSKSTRKTYKKNGYVLNYTLYKDVPSDKRNLAFAKSYGYTRCNTMTLPSTKYTTYGKKKKHLTGVGNKVRYTSTDKSVATVSSKGKVTAKGPGTAYIYITSVNGIKLKVRVNVVSVNYTLVFNDPDGYVQDMEPAVVEFKSEGYIPQSDATNDEGKYVVGWSFTEPGGQKSSLNRAADLHPEENPNWDALYQKKMPHTINLYPIWGDRLSGNALQQWIESAKAALDKATSCDASIKEDVEGIVRDYKEKIGSHYDDPDTEENRQEVASLLNEAYGLISDLTGTASGEALRVVTFNMNGHGFDKIQIVKKGSKTSAIESPTAAGYTFNDWYTTSTGDTKFDFSTKYITENTTIYAHWDPKSGTKYTAQYWGKSLSDDGSYVLLSEIPNLAGTTDVTIPSEIETIVLTADNNWSASYTNLPAYDIPKGNESRMANDRFSPPCE